LIYHDWATMWAVRGSTTDKVNGFFSSPKPTDLFWGPPSVLFSGFLGVLPGVERPGCEVDQLTSI